MREKISPRLAVRVRVSTEEFPVGEGSEVTCIPSYVGTWMNASGSLARYAGHAMGAEVRLHERVTYTHSIRIYGRRRCRRRCCGTPHGRLDIAEGTLRGHPRKCLFTYCAPEIEDATGVLPSRASDQVPVCFQGMSCSQPERKSATLSGVLTTPRKTPNPRNGA
jgi:hypothetical protein